MDIAQLTKLAGPDRRPKRVGRGRASGHGKTSGRGHKGSGQRAGWRKRALNEGGQMPLFRRVPKRGFSNARFQTRYAVVNVGALEERFEAGAHVTTQTLVEAGLIRNVRHSVKVLGDGALTKKLVVEAARYSEVAAEKIRAAGGEARIVE